MTRFVLGGAAGLLKRGTIDIDARLKVAVPVGGGKFASVRSVSGHLNPEQCRHFGLRNPPQNGAELLVPTVIPAGSGRWRVVSVDAAFSHAWSSGRHLGIFDTVAHANTYANRLHL
jgi:hypothetical protein